MRDPDPLDGTERAAAALEVASVLRHALRNRFTGMQAAVMALRRRLLKGVLDVDTVGSSFDAIDAAIVRADELLESHMPPGHLLPKQQMLLDARSLIETAAASARIGSDVAVDRNLDAGEVNGNPAELALAVRCL